MTNLIVTENTGFVPAATGSAWGSPIHFGYSEGTDANSNATKSPFDVQAAFLTVVENAGSEYAVAFNNETNLDDDDILLPSTMIENSILRENGDHVSDRSFYPNPSMTNDVFPFVFGRTWNCDLASGGFPGYTTANDNFYLDPKLRTAVFQGIDLGKTFPNSLLSSPVIDGGRSPIVSGTVSIDVRAASRPKDYPLLGTGSFIYDVGAFELDSSAGE